MITGDSEGKHVCDVSNPSERVPQRVLAEKGSFSG